MKKLCQSKILKNEQLADQYWKLVFDCPEIANEALPGQFIEVYFDHSLKIFPRPFSIAKVEHDALELIYKVIGSQTEIMASWKPGETVQILGPLGNFFVISDDTKTHILVGGGVGLAPMVFMSEVLKEKNFLFFCGGRNGREYFPEVHDPVRRIISTDDGSVGFHGNVVQCLEKEIAAIETPVVIYACGPEKMCEALKYFGEKHNIPVQISMETIMACGMGLCQGCALKTYDENGNDKISLVCKDGPIFKGEEINFG
ncbi:MAG: dihydroorotate dehydrogenase electron transfer subunit [Candidatus Marinimicrobia bacterium]|nr:dihydroorotate dehydrogenase electron transfer subunit [Candidatus Neomarinimicrobiota bacterium]